jgi:ATP-binding cassette subfamily B protein
MKINYHIKWIYKQWKDHKQFVVLLVFMTILSTAVTTAYPYVFKKIIDSFQKILMHKNQYPNPQKIVLKYIMIIFAIGLTQLVASLYPGLRAFMNVTFENALRLKYFKPILEKDYTFFNKFRTGDLVTRLTNDLTDFPKIGWFLCSGIFRAFESLNKIIFCLSIMFYLSWKMTFITLVPIPIMIGIFYVTSNKLYKQFQKNQEAISEINNQLEMSFSGVRIIKSFVCENKYKRFFDKALNERFKTEMNVVKLNTLLSMVYMYIDRFAQISVILYGGYLAVNNKITVGTFFAFYTYLEMLIFPILDLPQLFVSAKQAFVNIDRLEEIKNFPTTESHKKDKIAIHHIEKIKFENVSFHYNGEEEVLSNINMEIKKGDRVLILGPVGSGKSTILGLISSMYNPEEGRIKINNLSIEKIDKNILRTKIGYVTQEPLLFSGTIKENVQFGKENLSEKEFWELMEIVQLKQEILSFKDKEHSKVGQRGLSLSGGQKQRLSIARALVRNPEVLIFDDITASLDADNEAKLWNSINSKYKKITCFIVSHRLSTLRYVDKVIFVDSGNILGIGNHNELIKINPTYRSFINENLK